MQMAVGAPLSKDQSNEISGRALAVWEIVSVVVSCLIAEWVVLAFVGRSKLVLAIPVALALALMIFSHRAYGESARDVVGPVKLALSKYVPLRPAGLVKSRAAGMTCFAWLALLHDRCACAPRS